MADLKQIRASVEQAVSQRLSGQVDHLRRDIVDQVLQQIEPLLAVDAGASANGSRSPSSDFLKAAISSIQQSHAQAEILNGLLDGVAKLSARSALFVVRGTALAGWQARGFTDDNVRGLSIDGSNGLAARAIHERASCSAPAAEFDSTFAQKHGNPWDGNSTLFPLIVKDKVAAILYCDSGREAGRHTDYSAVEVLARFTCLWLEHAAGKKSAVAGAETVSHDAHSPAAGTSSLSSGAIAAKPVVAPAAPVSRIPTEEQDLHDKAKRFAKLLVDEIKLYNQSKVAEGKQNRDLYKLLREDIEKSRATYDKRYGSTPVASAKYFDAEIVRILADNDRSLLGSDFPG
ncbi:MAG: hypothetical protein ACJ71Q_14965 [Terriglobales bacterium]|jgi:hypothetical protein